MTHTTIAQLAAVYRDSLTDRLRALHGPLSKYQIAASLLSGTGIDVKETTSEDAIAQTINRWLKDLAASLTRDYAGNGLRKIDFAGGPGKFSFFIGEMEVGRQIRKSESVHDQLRAVVDNYPFEALAKSSLSQCAVLEERGLQEAADNLASQLRLVDHNNGVSVKQQRNRLITSSTFGSFMSSLSGYRYGDWDTIETISQLMKVVEAEMGDLGASAALDECVQIMKDAEERHPSRTKLLEGRPVEIVVFKNHMDIRIANDVADTILAFLALHASKPIVDLASAA